MWRRRNVGRAIHILRNIEEMRRFRQSLHGNSIAFIPTMGALHPGHISLMKEGKKENEKVIASIFVNPIQFGAGEDLDKYPRTFERDLELMNGIADGVFAPSTSEIYGPRPLCHVEPTQFNSIMEGQKRPEFFRGVATIVCKLFNIVQPTTSYFGQKDISQCILIRRMVDDLNIPCKIRVIETIRELDGLAMSSRNVYLRGSEERNAAAVLYRALQLAKSACDGSAVSSRESILQIVRGVLASEKLVTSVDYISIASHLDMTELDQITSSEGAVISSAVRLGNVRLIDNVLCGGAKDRILN